MKLEHRPDCQLLTVPVYGLCTCDLDSRAAAREAERMREKMADMAKAAEPYDDKI